MFSVTVPELKGFPISVYSRIGPQILSFLNLFISLSTFSSNVWILFIIIKLFVISLWRDLTTTTMFVHLWQWSFLISGEEEGVNFINILRAAFLNESVLHNFSVLTVLVCKFLVKEISVKTAHKLLVKLTKGGEEDQLSS